MEEDTKQNDVALRANSGVSVGSLQTESCHDPEQGSAANAEQAPEYEPDTQNQTMRGLGNSSSTYLDTIPPTLVETVFAHRSTILRYLARRFPALNIEDREDLFQEASLDIFDLCLRGRPVQDYLPAWLFLIVFRRGINLVMRRRRLIPLENAHHVQEIDEYYGIGPVHECSLKCQNTLDAKGKIIVQKKLHGMTNTEIKKECGIPDSTVDRRIKKFKDCVSQCLKKNGVNV